MQPELSIIVPTYREAENIAQLAPAIVAALNPLDLRWEIIVVDDDSDDDIAAVCERLAAEGVPLRLVVRTDERDLSTAIVHGFQQSQAPFLAVMDADLSHPPAALPEMLRRLRDGADFVLGSRFTAGGDISRDWPLHRRIASRVAALPAALITKVSDPMSGYFAIRRPCLEQAAPLRPVGYKIALELIAKCPLNRIEEVPIRFSDRKLGESKANLKQAVLYLRHLRRLYHHVHPNWSETFHFFSVGASGLVVDIVVFLSLIHGLDTHIVAAKTLSFIAAAVSNWFLNRHYSFVRAEKHAPSQQLPKFLAVSAIGMGVNVVLFWQLTMLSPWFKAHPLVALLIATVVTSAWNFLASKLLVFKTAFR